MGSITDVQAATKPQHDFKTAAIAGFAGGNLSSFVKWGSEIPFPPREAGRISPPFAILKALGLNAEDMTYVFTGHVINYGVALVHQGFSVVFGLLYCLLSIPIPLVTLWQGLAFGLIVTVLFHAILLPLGGWAPQIWDVSAHETFSEVLGHLLWAWTIEIVRRAMLCTDEAR
jgi:putative membrane protein